MKNYGDTDAFDKHFERNKEKENNNGYHGN